MKIFKKIMAAVSSALLVAALCTSVTAEEVVGFDYAPAGGNYVYYDFTADDGATGTLTFTKDEDGNLLFSSYKIDAPVPKNLKDFPDGYSCFMDDFDFWDYLYEFAEKNGKDPYLPNCTGIVAKFNVDFDPPLSDGTLSMSGGKCYIADLETMTVSYVGYFCEYTEDLSENDADNAVYCEYRAEDGTWFGLHFAPLENGELEFTGCESEDPLNVGYAYSTDENSRIIISSIAVEEVDTGYTLYSDPDMIPLAANEVLVSTDVEQYVEDGSGRLAAVLNIKKYFVITVDGMNSTVRYAGCSYNAVDMYPYSEPSPDSNWSDGETTSPNTGNGSRYLNIMLAAAGLAVLAKRAKK